jgi:hypothetical protein
MKEVRVQPYFAESGFFGGRAIQCNLVYSFQVSIPQGINPNLLAICEHAEKALRRRLIAEVTFQLPLGVFDETFGLQAPLELKNQVFI